MKRPKKVVHEWFSAVLRGSTLTPARGCVRKVVELGEEIVERATNENHRRLTANIGDRFMLFGASVDQIQIVEVTAIRVDGWRSSFVVSRGIGGVNDGAVHVHKLKEADLDALIDEWIRTCPCDCCERYRKAFAARAGFFAAKIEEQLRAGGQR